MAILKSPSPKLLILKIYLDHFLDSIKQVQFEVKVAFGNAVLTASCIHKSQNLNLTIGRKVVPLRLFRHRPHNGCF